MDYYKGTIPIIDDAPDAAITDLMHPKGANYGYDPDSVVREPYEMKAPPSEMRVYEESEWDALYDEQEATKSSLEHLYLSGPGGTPVFTNLDQNGHGYCWAYSTGHAIMLDRLKQGLPNIRLNPHSVAAIIKGGRDQGGWCGLSAKFLRETGIAEEGNGPGQWPLHSRDLRYDTPACRAEMAKRLVTEDWVDLTKSVYDQNLTTRQIATCGFNNIPHPEDFNHWGHSVCGIRWVRIERGSWGTLILNSWLNWGRYGLGVLRGGKAICDGAVAFRVTKST